MLAGVSQETRAEKQHNSTRAVILVPLPDTQGDGEESRLGENCIR